MYDYNVLIQRITSYKKFRETAELDKSIRRPNFPEDISENLVRLFLNCENIKPGDLYSKTLQKIEVKNAFHLMGQFLLVLKKNGKL